MTVVLCTCFLVTIETHCHLMAESCPCMLGAVCTKKYVYPGSNDVSGSFGKVVYHSES